MQTSQLAVRRVVDQDWTNRRRVRDEEPLLCLNTTIVTSCCRRSKDMIDAGSRWRCSIERWIFREIAHEVEESEGAIERGSVRLSIAPETDCS